MVKTFQSTNSDAYSFLTLTRLTLNLLRLPSACCARPYNVWHIHITPPCNHHEQAAPELIYNAAHSKASNLEVCHWGIAPLKKFKIRWLINCTNLEAPMDKALSLTTAKNISYTEEVIFVTCQCYLFMVFNHTSDPSNWNTFQLNKPCTHLQVRSWLIQSICIPSLLWETTQPY